MTNKVLLKGKNIKLTAMDGRLYDPSGKVIQPAPDGFCKIGDRTFVYEKLYAFVLKNQDANAVVPLTVKKSKRSKASKVVRKQKEAAPIEKKRKPKTNAHRLKPVLAMPLQGGTILRFKSRTQAASTLGISRGNISMVLGGKRNHAGGYTFVSVEKEVTDV